jgi:hypothetical protein
MSKELAFLGTEEDADAVKRVLEFLRSVLPANAIQLLFICGTLFLFVGALLPWAPRLPFHIPPAESVITPASWAVDYLVLWCGSIFLVFSFGHSSSTVVPGGASPC